MIQQMVTETRSPEETYALGEKIGKAAQPGQIYTLTGDLGVGKTVFTQGVAARHLQLCRCMKRGVFLSIILMCTELEISKRWKKSDMMIISLEMASV